MPALYLQAGTGGHVLRRLLLSLFLGSAQAQCELDAAKVEFALSNNPDLKVMWTDGTSAYTDAIGQVIPNFIDADTDRPPFPSGNVRILNAGEVNSPYHPQNGQRFDIIVSTPATADMTEYGGTSSINSAPFFTPIEYRYPQSVNTQSNAFAISDLGYMCLGYGLPPSYCKICPDDDPTCSPNADDARCPAVEGVDYATYGG
jgi:hypothetical protein